MNVYIKQYNRRELWTGKDWTGAFELAKAYTPTEAAIVLRKRWSKGTRQYYKRGGYTLLRYRESPIIQTKEELGRWERI